MTTFEYTHYTNSPESTALRSAWYNHNSGKMWVETTNGSLYGYRDVPLSAWSDYFKAPSKGRAWAKVRETYVPLREPAPGLFTAKYIPLREHVAAPPAKDEFTVTFSVSGTLTVTGTADGYDDAVAKATKILEDQMVGNFTVEGVVKNK